MKYFIRVLLSLFTISYLSCSGKSESESAKYLTMEIGKSSAILIPSPATTLSCDQIAKGQTSTGSITGSYFTLPNPVIKWSETATPDLSEVRVVALKFSLKSPKIGGEYNCIFSDLALGSLYYKTTIDGQTVTTVVWDAKLGKNSAAQKNSTAEILLPAGALNPCDIKCGGINIPKGSGLFSVTGIWELFAVQRKYPSADSVDYEETPIKITGSFTVDNVLE